MNHFKQAIRDLIGKLGYSITRHGQEGRGHDPFADMQFFLKGVERPTILDVGANIGQTVDRFKTVFPNSSVHSFEPSPGTYAKLQQHCNGREGVTTWNAGVGASKGTLPFTENSKPDMSSFLAPSELCWGTVEKVTSVEVVTLDEFAREQGVEFIHVLKSDTQGYDFEVFKGAEGLMKQNKIALVYFEFIFSDMYKNLPSFHEVYRFLAERNFVPVSFYESHFQQDLVSWTDVMFINRDFNRGRAK